MTKFDYIEENYIGPNNHIDPFSTLISNLKNIKLDHLVLDLIFMFYWMCKYFFGYDNFS